MNWDKARLLYELAVRLAKLFIINIGNLPLIAHSCSTWKKYSFLIETNFNTAIHAI